MKWLRLVGVLSLTVSAAAQQPAKASPRGSFRISGKVVNAVTGDALSNVEVTIGRNQDGEAAQSVVSADGGRFQFENLPAGKYWLAAHGHGFSPQRFNEHENYSTAIAVGSDLNSRDLVFRLWPDATIMGTVLDEQSEPVRNANVMLFGAALYSGATSTQFSNQTVTDDRGVYHFSHVRSGIYYIAVSAQPWYADVQPRVSGGNFRFGREELAADPSAGEEAPDPEFDVTYPVTYYAAGSDPSGATPIALKAGDRFTADMVLSPVPALHLRITGIDSSHGVAANLTERSMSGYRIPLNTRQMNFGNQEIEIAGIAPGQFDLTLQTGGTNPVVRQEHLDMTGDARTDVAAARDTPTINGLIRLDSARPLSKRSFVTFFDRSSGQTFGARVSEKGEFNVSGEAVSPGVYEIFFYGIRDAAVKEISASGAKVTGQQVEIAPGASASLIVTISQGVGRVDGTVLRDGKGLAGAMVVLVPEDITHNITLVRRDQSDSDGTFSLYSVLPGKYTAIAVANGWDMQWTNPEVLKPYLSRGSSVDVAAHGKYTIKVDVQ
jgi:protocatechuate 3,4-dioxygenase beta subunit